MSSLPATIPGLLQRGMVVRHKRAYYVVSSDPEASDEGALCCVVADDADFEELDASELTVPLTERVNLDQAVRWLAQKVGLKVGVTCPAWFRNAFGTWVLWVAPSENGTYRDADDHIGFTIMPSNKNHNGPIPKVSHGTYWGVPGIDDVTDPIEALRMAILSTGTYE